MFAQVLLENKYFNYLQSTQKVTVSNNTIAKQLCIDTTIHYYIRFSLQLCMITFRLYNIYILLQIQLQLYIVTFALAYNYI